MITALHPIIRSPLSRSGATTFIASSQHIVESFLSNGCTSSTQYNNRRHFASRATIGPDPLEVLRKECTARKKCDEEGRRLKTTDHWTLSVAIASTDTKVVRVGRKNTNSSLNGYRISLLGF